MIPNHIPTHVPSLMGPLEVHQDPTMEERKLLGEACMRERKIRIQPSMHPLTAWQTLFHEMIHVVLFDAGVKLAHDKEEAVCDAMGTFLAEALRGGFLAVSPGSASESPL